MSIDVALCPRTHIIHPGGRAGVARGPLGRSTGTDLSRPTDRSTDVRPGKALDDWEAHTQGIWSALIGDNDDQLYPD